MGPILGVLLFTTVLGVLWALWFRQQAQHLRESELVLQQQLNAVQLTLNQAAQRVQFLESNYGPVELAEQRAKMARLEAERVEYDHQQALARLGQERKAIEDQVRSITAHLAKLEETETLVSSGFYNPHYEFSTAAGYSAQLDAIVDRQKEAIKSGSAIVSQGGWTVDGSKKAGDKMIKEYSKLILRAFNGECDAAISKVRFDNITVMERRIENAFEAINKIASVNRCEIARHFMGLKLAELRLSYEWALKKNSEREEQRALREQMREEERTRKELEKAREEAEREERRQQVALEKARKEASLAVGAVRAEMDAKLAELEAKLAEARSKVRATSQAELTSLGHVYVLSNIGSFGEGMYKIGMTRRLEPQDRVDELGDASVPFAFDVHAMVKTSNAPAMEKALHEVFHQRRVNRENDRKEFFYVTLDEVERAIREYASRQPQSVLGEVQFTQVAAAEEFRASFARRASESSTAVRAAEAIAR